MKPTWESDCGRVTLYLGDCLDVLPTLEGVDAVVTDPPYGIGFAAQPTKWQRRKGMSPKDWDHNTPCLRFLLDRCEPVFIWGGNYHSLPVSRGWLAWVKPDAPPSMGNIELCWTSLNQNAKHFQWSIGATNAERVDHPTQKPIALMGWCLGFIPDSTAILDPFMGSGTTGVAAIQLDRKFIGIEIDPGYFEIAKKRIEEALIAPKQEEFAL